MKDFDLRSAIIAAGDELLGGEKGPERGVGLNADPVGHAANDCHSLKDNDDDDDENDADNDASWEKKTRRPHPARAAFALIFHVSDRPAIGPLLARVEPLRYRFDDGQSHHMLRHVC